MDNRRPPSTAPASCRSTTSRATHDTRQPAVVIDATHAQALADLGRDRRQRRPPTPTATCIIRPARNFTEGHRYVVALRRSRDATASARPDGRLPGLPRRRITRDSAGRAAARAPHGARSSRRSPTPASRARPVPRLGLHRRQRAQPLRARAADPQRRLREARRHQPRRPQGPGHAPPITLNPDTPTCDQRRLLRQHPQQTNQDGIQDYAPATARAASPARIWLAPGRGQITVPCYLDQPGCPPGSRFAYASKTATKPTLQPIPGNTMLANFTCNIPRVALRRRRRARRRSTATACSAARRRDQPEPAEGLRPGARHRLLRDRLGRHGARRPANVFAAAQPTSRTSARSPTARSRATLDFSSTSRGR